MTQIILTKKYVTVMAHIIALLYTFSFECFWTFFASIRFYVFHRFRFVVVVQRIHFRFCVTWTKKKMKLKKCFFNYKILYLDSVVTFLGQFYFFQYTSLVKKAERDLWKWDAQKFQRENSITLVLPMSLPDVVFELIDVGKLQVALVTGQDGECRSEVRRVGQLPTFFRRRLQQKI